MHNEIHRGYERRKYLQVKDNIKNWILSGKIEPDGRIPSENQLADLFGISRHTVRQAIGELVNEGWLLREQGKGTFVRLDDLLVDSAGGKNKRIGVITTYLADYIFPHIISGIESYLAQRGYTLSLLSTGNNTETERRCLETMLVENIDGLIVEPTKSTLPSPNIDLYLLLQRRNIPFVMLHSTYTELNSSMVALDDSGGSYAATKHLIDLGHKDIAGIFKSDDMQGRNRFRGFVKAHQDARMPVNSKFIMTYGTEERDSIVMQFTQRLFKTAENNKPSAVVCYNDEIALRLINDLRDAGLSVPSDVSVTGFDDSPLALVGGVPLTTVIHPKAEMGEMAAKLLLNLISDKESMWVPLEHVFKPDLVIRDSTVPPGGNLAEL